jgi:hypothetical protein
MKPTNVVVTPTLTESAHGGSGLSTSISTDHSRNKTFKKSLEDLPQDESFKNLLDESAREAYARPWHRLERGLRLNRLRLYVEEVGPQCSFTKDEKDNFFLFLQKALDKKLLNTNKVVNYEPERQKIMCIRGLEVRRVPDGTAKWGFTIKKTKADATRRKPRVEGGAIDKIEAPAASVATSTTPISESKI